MTDSKDEEIKKLRESFRQFTYIISHDLSAPMRTISAFTRLLEEHCGDKLDDKAKHYLHFITQSGEKSQNMLTGLLQYSRLNTVENNPVDIDMKKIVQECLTGLKEEIDNSKAVIEVGDMPVIKADIDQIKQLFTALISNAVKFAKPDEKPYLKISAERLDNGWEFKFEDKGIGIDPKFHNDIFNVFRRLHRDEEYPGIGMGLPIARKIAELHNGDISIDSSANGNSTFRYLHQL